MSQHEAHAVLEPAATRVRDPLTGRSVWSAGLIKDARIDGDTLRFTLQCADKHSDTDRERMRAGLLRHILTAGWGGEIACQVVVQSAQAPKPQVKKNCLLYTSPSPRDGTKSRMPSSA